MMTPFIASSALSTATLGANEPPLHRPALEADLSQQVARHAGMHCICALIDCCHNEFPEDGYAFLRGHHTGHHADSGSPQSGYLYPWEPGDESWRNWLSVPELARAASPALRDAQDGQS